MHELRHSNGSRDDLSIDVAIIGAGVSGLYSGFRLLTGDFQAGKTAPASVHLFEMSDRVGGRLESIRLPKSGVIGELGGMRNLAAHEIVNGLMDVRMPEMDGIEATQHIRDDHSIDTRVLILTTFDLDEYVYAAMRAGASGFLLKDTPAKELAAAVRVIAEGNALLAPTVTKRLIEEFANQPEPSEAKASLPDDLTDREHEALILLARGMSNREIAAEMFVGEATAKTHVSRLLAKLGVRDRVQAVVLAYEAGIVTPGAPEPGTHIDP